MYVKYQTKRLNIDGVGKAGRWRKGLWDGLTTEI